jgi:inorganic pyrophosphatase
MSEVTVYIEIDKHSNFKYEFNKETGQLELDRLLSYPYFYPYSYGFIPNTKSLDGDEIDVLIVSDGTYTKDTFVKAFIVGALIMEDEKGMDEKLLVVTEKDYKNNVHDIKDLEQKTLDDIRWFFTNYKKTDKNRWSKVSGFVGRDEAIDLYNASVMNNC